MPWDLVGNAATNPATNFLGTTDNQPLVIRTNGTERVRVNGNGNFQVGNAGVAATARLTVGVPSSPNPIGALSVDVESFQTVNNVLQSYFFRVRDIDAAPPDGLTHFAIRGDGSVGIGTAQPGSRLHINLPSSATPLRAMQIDVQSFQTMQNAQASHFLLIRDIGAGPTGNHLFVRGDGNI